MRVGWREVSLQSPLTLSRKDDGEPSCAQALSRWEREPEEQVVAEAVIINEWLGSLIDAVEAAGPQRLEIEGRPPVIVMPLDTYRSLSGHRPSYVDMLRDFGVPDGDLPGEQAPFNVAGRPVPHKY